MPEPGYCSLTVREGLRDEISHVGNLIGIYGNKNVQRTIRHLIKLAEERPDFFHVLNKRRKYPEINYKYASL